jgi:uncharacterized protein YdhG (YjbR/CyaY superfamily)
MAKTRFASVADYISSHPPEARAVLERVRLAIRRAVPGAEEVISYQIPTFKLRGRPVLYFAAWKEHYSIYPAGASMLAAFKELLAGYETSKGTIRFPYSEPVPVRLIAGIAKLRAMATPASERVVTATERKRSTPSNVNARWHLAHKMPKNATDMQRIRWHVTHARHCGCRPIPAGVRALMRAKGVPAPRR